MGQLSARDEAGTMGRGKGGHAHLVHDVLRGAVLQDVLEGNASRVQREHEAQRQADVVAHQVEQLEACEDRAKVR